MGHTMAGARASAARFGPWRREVRAFLELLALTGVTVAQPTFDLLANNAASFVSLDTTWIQAVLLATVVVLVPATALWVIEVLIGAVVPPARRFVHALLAAAVLSVLAVEVLKHQTDIGTVALVFVAVPLGLLGGVAVL